MKKKLRITIFISGLFTLALFVYPDIKAQYKINKLRAKHAAFLENSPFKETLSFSKEERKTLGIPPNKYNERQWELTMNPALGYPEPQKAAAIQKMLRNPKTNLAYRVPGDGADNQWIERGPDNVGGRTRVVFFDPNDATNLRVFAGSVSGGLWVTDDITTNGGWTQVTDVPGNMNVSCYTIDPNDSNIWYIGTGEQYISSSAVGNGVYRTTDGGNTWTHVPVQLAGGGSFNLNPEDYFVAGVYYINGIIAWDNAGSTEIFVGVGTNRYRRAASPTNWLGMQSAGLYRSTDSGSSWSRIESPNMEFNINGGSYYYIPNDFEISADNTLWMATKNTPGFGGASGQIYSSVDGAVWTQEYQVPNGRRVEIETSATDAGKIYVLAETVGIPLMYVTNNAFATNPTPIITPDDDDVSIPSFDFTRGQAYYDLVLEAAPDDDDIVCVGGINIHRSTNSGGSWNTISHWSDFYTTIGSMVHADQQAFAFRPGNNNQAVVGHDGGVSFASDLAAVGNNLTAIYDVDDDYNVTQFYHMGVAPVTFAANSFMAGAQDNGTLSFSNADPGGPDSAVDISGGDGAYSFYDQVDTDYLITNFIYNNSIDLFDFSIDAWRTIASNSNYEGDFINPQALDSNQDVLYSNGATEGTYQLFRYEGLTNLAAGVEAVRTVLTNPLLNASITAMEVSPHYAAHTKLLAGLENGRLLHISRANAGPLWREITGPSFVGSISDVQFGQTGREIFVTFHNYGVTSIWYTNNGGISWQNKEGNLPDMPVTCILQNPFNEEEVIVGTELGIWRTANFSAASPIWMQSHNGMSDVKVTDLQLRDDGMVFACTYGRGIFSGKFNATTGTGLGGLQTKASTAEDEALMANEIKIYPTISDGEINISSTIELGETRLDIFNLKGEQVYSARQLISLNSVNTLQLHTLSSGIYLMNFSSGAQKFTRKFIIK